MQERALPAWEPPPQRLPRWVPPCEPRPIGFLRGMAPVLIIDVSGACQGSPLARQRAAGEGHVDQCIGWGRTSRAQG